MLSGHFPIETMSDNAGMSFRINGHASTYHLPLLGEHNIMNALPAIAAAALLGLEESDIREGLSQLKITPMRMEQIPTSRGFTIINDAWNASPITVRSAISSLHKFVTTGKKVLVLGDMLELGDLEAMYHEQMSDVIRDSDIDVVFTYGRASKIISDSLANTYPQDHIKHFTDKTELANACLDILRDQDIVLFKASRGMKLEEVCDMLK